MRRTRAPLGVTRAGGRGDRYLTWDERKVLSVRRHPAVLVPPCLHVLAAALAAMATSPPYGGKTLSDLLWWVTLGLLLRFLWRGWLWSVDHIVVTDRRVFETSGVFNRNVASMPLGKVTDMTYRRNVWGRLLGYGEFIVESAGQEQALSRIDHLPQPDHFYRTLTWLVFGRP
ncbi:MAG TPA: PH domain-containing protein [Egibacteraceae bacterium]|nr:PH domain-containing protein [Egibacteraceae bacterium]